MLTGSSGIAPTSTNWIVPPVFNDETAVGTDCGAAEAPGVPVAPPLAAVGEPPVAARVALAAPALVAEAGAVVALPPLLLLLLLQPARPSATKPEAAAPALSTRRRLTLPVAIARQ